MYQVTGSCGRKEEQEEEERERCNRVEGQNIEGHYWLH